MTPLKRRIILFVVASALWSACADSDSMPGEYAPRTPLRVEREPPVQAPQPDVAPTPEPLGPAKVSLEPLITLEAPVIGGRATARVELRHASGVPVIIRKVELEQASGHFQELDVSTPARDQLHAGAPTAAVTLSYLPLDLEADSATLRWHLEDELGASWVEQQRVEATVALVRELNYPDRIDVGRAAQGKTLRVLLPIYNASSRAVTLRDVYTIGAPGAEVFVASSTHPQEPRHDARFDPEAAPMIPVGGIGYLAAHLTMTSDEAAQVGVMFVSTVGTRQIMLRVNSGVPCLSLRGAQAQAGGDFGVAMGVVQPHVTRQHVITAWNCSDTRQVTISRVGLALDAKGQLQLALPWQEGDLTLEPGQEAQLSLSLTPTAPEVIEGVLRLQSDDPQRQVTRVLISADSSKPCPLAPTISLLAGASWLAEATGQRAQARVGQPVRMISLLQALGLRVEWSLARSPVNSTAGFAPSAFDPQPTLTPDLPGAYVVEVFTRDEQGVRSCASAQLALDVLP